MPNAKILGGGLACLSMETPMQGAGWLAQPLTTGQNLSSSSTFASRTKNPEPFHLEYQRSVFDCLTNSERLERIDVPNDIRLRFIVLVANVPLQVQVNLLRDRPTHNASARPLLADVPLFNCRSQSLFLISNLLAYFDVSYISLLQRRIPPTRNEST